MLSRWLRATPVRVWRHRSGRGIRSVLALAVASLSAGTPNSFAAAIPEFATEVRPLLEKHCTSCHGRLKQKGHLRLDAGALALKGGKNGPAVLPRQSLASHLIQRLRDADPERRMPPEGAPLADSEIDLIAAWIDAGASLPARETIPPSPSEHWSFQPVHRPTPPTVTDPTWNENPIDRFVRNRLDAAEVRPAPPAPPGALLRRLHLDLIGLPPTPAEQDACAADSSPTAFSRTVDQLLTRPEYGERWARHWLDLVRYADSNGYERDAAKPLAWQYRDYVIRSLNADKPYARFVQEQLAGDELPDASSETIIATGFYRLGHWDDEPADPITDRYDQLDDILRTTSEVFLGLSLGCARCHDHKFEPLSTQDYYSFLSIFEPLRRPQNGRTELTLPAGTARQIAALAQRDQVLAQLDRETDRALQEFRIAHLKIGQSQLSSDTQAAWLIPAEQRNAEQQRLVADSKRTLDAELDHARPESLRRQLADLGDRRERLLRETPDLPPAYFLNEPTATQLPVSHILIRGNATRPGREVSPGLPEILTPSPVPFPKNPGGTSHRRLTFSRWLTSPENPLSARVLVNRVWQQHFGVGLVRTPGDFGLMGESPTHPELLDWLADWFVRDAGGSLKKLHRLILTSRTWQASRTASPSAEQLDPENRLWSHLPLKRLEVEAIRDSMLAVSGQLNPQHFGPPMFPAIPAQALEANTDKESIWKASDELDQNRRTLYTFIKRGLVVPMLEVLDLCDTVQSSSRRQTTTVAPQALTLFNGDLTRRLAQAFAERLRREAGESAAAQIEWAYRLALARRPRPEEKAALLRFLVAETAAGRAENAGQTPDPGRDSPEIRALQQCVRAVLNLNEFVYPD